MDMARNIPSETSGLQEQLTYSCKVDDNSLSEESRLSIYDIVATFFICDIITIIASGLLSLWVSGYNSSTSGNYRALIVLFIFLYVVISRAIGVYKTRLSLKRKQSVGRALFALLSSFGTVVAIAVVTNTETVYLRSWFWLWAGLTCAIASVSRLVVISSIRRRLQNGAFLVKAISAAVFAEPIDSAVLERSNANEVRVVGTFRMKSLNEIDRLSEALSREDIDQIYVVAPWADVPTVFMRLMSLRQFAADVFVLPAERDIHELQLGASTVNDCLSLKAVSRPIDGWDIWLKRVQDIVLSVSILLFFLPVLIIIAVAIKLDSPGPIFFRQERVGFNGRRFQLWKFRSMYAASTDLDAACQTARGDSRVTRVGRFIRRTSLDELPQFLNVLDGSMSVVGPRPHALMTTAGGYPLEAVADQYAARHRVKPGITGLAQVNGCRGELDTIEKLRHRVRYDIDYIDNWCTWLDIKIILRTVLLILYDPTAY